MGVEVVVEAAVVGEVHDVDGCLSDNDGGTCMDCRSQLPLL